MATGPVAAIHTSRQSPMPLSGGSGFQSTNVMARSPGSGGKTSIASALDSPGRATAVMSNSNRRQAPASLSEAAICLPLSHTLARKLSPSKPSQAVLPRISAGILNSVRNHHGLRKGLSSGIGRLEKFTPMPYFTPGTDRRFMSKYGSGNFFAATSALKTVEGTAASVQSRGRKPAADSAAPVSRTSAEDRMAQPCRRSILFSGAAATTATAQAKARKNRRIKKFLATE